MTKYAIYGYDADGTRVQKEEDDSVKKYYYVGNDMVCTTDNVSAVFTGIFYTK